MLPLFFFFFFTQIMYQLLILFVHSRAAVMKTMIIQIFNNNENYGNL
jgi:hypothetical protein